MALAFRIVSRRLVAKDAIQASSRCAHRSSPPASKRWSLPLLTVFRYARLRRNSLIGATVGSWNDVSFNRYSPSVWSPVTFGTFCLNCHLQVGVGLAAADSRAAEIARS